MLYLKLYQTKEDFTAAETVTPTEEYVSSVIPGVAAVKEDKKNAWYNQVPSDRKMTVEELIDGGYADFMRDGARNFRGTETGWTVLQIHSNCPVKLENITNFDAYLTSATTFVWREELPNGWNANDLAAKYNNVELARPLMAEMFPCVDMSGVNELSLSFNGGGWQTIHTSIVTERYHEGGNYYPNSKFKSPKHLTVTLRDTYSSVLQCNFSMLKTTTGLTINCPNGDGMLCHDVIGMFEMSGIKTLEFNGKFSWSAIRSCRNMFDGCGNLESISYSSAWARENGNNTLYPHAESPFRGTASCGGLFTTEALKYIGPVINMNMISIDGISPVLTYWNPNTQQMETGPVYQGRIVSEGKPMFNCPVLTDVRIINLNNNDWNFADGSTYTRIPQMDVTSIEYLLNHVADCSETPHTVTFSTLHQGEISESTIENARAKGWTVAFQSAE